MNEISQPEIEPLFNHLMKSAGLDIPAEWRSEVTAEYALLRNEIALVHSIAQRGVNAPHPYDTITAPGAEP